MKFEDINKVIEGLTDLKNHEAHYAEINKYQAMINYTQALKDAFEMMAADFAETKGKSKEDLIADYYAKL